MGTRRHRSRRSADAAVRRAVTAAAGLLVLLGVAATVVVVALHRAGTLAGTGHAPGAPGRAPHGSPGGGSRPAPPPALRLDSTTPAPGASGVAYSPTVVVQLSAPLAAGSPLPTISPTIAGSWSSGPTGALVFHADGQFPPWTTVRVDVPGGPAGVRAADGSTLPAGQQTTFTVEGGSELRLQQLLAELGYLPLSFVPDASAVQTESVVSGAPAAGTTPALEGEPTNPELIPLSPLAGTFAWRYPHTPPLLKAAWSAGSDNVATHGAVMAFEAVEGLQVDGDAGPAVWRALLGAVASRHTDPAPYDYISVQERRPQTLFVWQDGSTILSFSANTGIPVEPTAKGTYPVYARYLVTTMTGKNPNGSVYHDPGIPHVAYFNGGDAIHGFIRAAYGFPQSLGCVELSYADAAAVWPYDQLGTLVTVY